MRSRFKNFILCFYFRYQWVYTCQSFSYSYASSGLFGIHGCAPPERLDDLVTIMAKELCQVSKADMTQAIQV